MSQHHPVVRQLRRYLFHGFRDGRCARRVFSSAVRSHKGRDARKEVTHDYEQRVEQLNAATGSDLSKCYPRLPERFGVKRKSLAAFRHTYERLEVGEILSEPVTVVGRCRRGRSRWNATCASGRTITC